MKLLKIILSILLLLTLGYFRESLFVNMNLRLYELGLNTRETLRNEWISFLDPLSYLQLYIFKWIATALFTIAFYGAGMLVLKAVYQRYYFKEFGLVYLGLTLAAVITMGIVWLFTDVHKGYLFARFFMGLAQSPFPIIFMIPALFLGQRFSLSEE